MPTKATTPFGLVAEFNTPEAILEAAQRAQQAGYTRAEAYTPFPIEGLSGKLGYSKTWVARVVMVGAICGGCGAFFMMWYANVISYTWNIGGKPPNSWPAFIPITFELSVLGAALAAVIGMLSMNGLPSPYHAMFNLPRFSMASRDRFFLCIESGDPKFDMVATRQFLESLAPLEVTEVAK